MVALSRACFERATASAYSVAASSSADGYITGTGAGLSSGYSSGN